jgi:hypothetical protein
MLGRGCVHRDEGAFRALSYFGSAADSPQDVTAAGIGAMKGVMPGCVAEGDMALEP